MPEQGHPGRGNIQMVSQFWKRPGRQARQGRPTRDGKCKRQLVWPRSGFQLTQRSLLMPLHGVGKADHSGSSIWQRGQRACLDFTWGYNILEPRSLRETGLGEAP